ncbi:flagellar motor switch protein flin [hydrocarbon metagenome]|uniref:Flagellar motor switch protein flin n=1 Tax=hydrocarbon metagenome TaxID=938273 RepID=A0A0W8E5C8_9ZZZZ
MSDGILSQEEIDALLSGGGSNSTEGSSELQAQISEYQKDTLGEIGNISMGTAATTLSLLLKRKVSITTPLVTVTTRQEIQNEYPLPYVIAEVQYTQGLSGSNLLTVKAEDACLIADLMMGKESIERRVELDELDLSAVGEAMNQMMGSATTSLSSMFNQRIDIAPPIINVIDLSKDNFALPTDYTQLVQIKFKMEIEDMLNSEIMQIIPMEAVTTMIKVLERNVEDLTANEVASQVSYEEPSYEQPQPIFQEEPEYVPTASEPVINWSDTPRMNSSSPIVGAGDPHTIQPVQFSILQESRIGETPQNISLIMDVPLDVSVELGKTRKTIKEVLELQQGSIIQLDKMAGEPVDLLVNGKLIAKGEVVVIDENYGIRITTIISPMDRVNKLQ